MQINGESKCYVCGETIRWCSSIRVGNDMEWVTKEKDTVSAEIVAIGKLATSEGNRIRFEVIVKCPCCENKNKFEAVGTAPTFV
jgi:sarcosine oxidase delta subunit